MNCEIIRDLLPLYADKCCSEETYGEVARHLSECTECSKIYKQMNCELSADTVFATPEKMRKVCYWKASVLQSALLFVSFAVIAAGVALEAGIFSSIVNGFWAFTMVIPATGFMLSLANWYFIRLYGNSKFFSICSTTATVGIIFAAFIWACFHYDMSLFNLFDSLDSTFFFLPGFILSLVFCVVSKIASKKYASLIGKE